LADSEKTFLEHRLYGIIDELFALGCDWLSSLYNNINSIGCNHLWKESERNSIGCNHLWKESPAFYSLIDRIYALESVRITINFGQKTTILERKKWQRSNGLAKLGTQL